MHEGKKNIVVCGYPKSGSTWATRLTAELLGCPATGYWTFEGPTLSTEGTDRQSDLNCYKSHEQYDDLIKNTKTASKIVYILRDPRDMAVSGMFHFTFQGLFLKRILNMLPLPSRLKSVIGHLSAKSKRQYYKANRMVAMLAHGDEHIPHCQWALDTHISSFVNKPGVLFIRYEELLHNGLREAQKITEHCGINKTDREIQIALSNQSFKNKKRSFEVASNESKHLRKGVSGDWINHLSKDQKKQIEQACQHQKLQDYYTS